MAHRNTCPLQGIHACSGLSTRKTCLPNSLKDTDIYASPSASWKAGRSVLVNMSTNTLWVFFFNTWNCTVGSLLPDQNEQEPNLNATLFKNCKAI